jgi:hypothetical protein
MRKCVAKTQSLVQKGLWLAVFLYLMFLLGAAALVRAQFGRAYMIGVSLILAFPLAVAFDLIRRGAEAQRRELLYLLALTIAAGGSALAVTWNAHRMGVDREHAKHEEYACFLRNVRENRAFDAVDLYVTPKDIFWMRGSVATDADLARLESLAARCRLIRWNTSVEVTAAMPRNNGTAEAD